MRVQALVCKAAWQPVPLACLCQAAVQPAVHAGHGAWRGQAGGVQAQRASRPCSAHAGGRQAKLDGPGHQASPCLTCYLQKQSLPGKLVINKRNKHVGLALLTQADGRQNWMALDTRHALARPAVFRSNHCEASSS